MKGSSQMVASHWVESMKGILKEVDVLQVACMKESLKTEAFPMD